MLPWRIGQARLRRGWVIQHTAAMPEELAKYYRANAWMTLDNARKGNHREIIVPRTRQGNV